MTPTTPVGRLALNEVLKGLCPDPGQVPFTLDREAEIVCAGR